MKKSKNRIKSVAFLRYYELNESHPRHKIVLDLEFEIPAVGYGCKKIIKMLKEYGLNI